MDKESILTCKSEPEKRIENDEELLETTIHQKKATACRNFKNIIRHMIYWHICCPMSMERAF
jgi:hypothetical protein